MRIMYGTNPHTQIVTPRQIVDEIFFSPQTRYFNAGLGRTEVYIW